MDIINKKITDINGNEINIEYKIIHENQLGIEIISKVNEKPESAKIIIESGSEEKAFALMNFLAENSVTPISVHDVCRDLKVGAILDNNIF